MLSGAVTLSWVMVFALALGVTTTSGPGLALKSESIGLAVMTELPLVIFDVQRGGPSTGLPTKTEQSDLYQAVYGRNGDAPMPVIAARSPGDASKWRMIDMLTTWSPLARRMPRTPKLLRAPKPRIDSWVSCA